MEQDFSVPWTVLDNWIGVALLILIDVVLLVIVSLKPAHQLAQSAGIVLAELAYLLPVVAIFAWKRISWKYVRFSKFNSLSLGLGCGLLVGAYLLVLLHNVILVALGVDTQGQEILDLFNQLDSPGWFIFMGAIFAPLVEEIFFRGFLFQGFRQKYGWKIGIVLSSFVFAAAHLDPVAFIPTFVLGAALAYLYHRSNSIWPGVILHFSVNAVGLLGAYLATQFPSLIPL